MRRADCSSTHIARCIGDEDVAEHGTLELIGEGFHVDGAPELVANQFALATDGESYIACKSITTISLPGSRQAQLRAAVDAGGAGSVRLGVERGEEFGAGELPTAVAECLDSVD